MLATLPALLCLPSTSWTANLSAIRLHDTRGSRYWFQRLSILCISAALLTFLQRLSTSLLAVLNATRLHIMTCGSQHWFQPSSSSLCISAAQPQFHAHIYSQACVHLTRPQLHRRLDALPFSYDHWHDLYFQSPTPPLAPMSSTRSHSLACG
jgi:hypothetical protein